MKEAIEVEAALRLALEAFETLTQYDMVRANIFRRFEPTCTGDYVDLREFREKAKPAINAIKEALAQQSNEQVETFGWGRIDLGAKMFYDDKPMLSDGKTFPLYTHPPVPTAQPKEHDDSAVHFAHCNIGENEGCCKYGDDDCPVIANLKAQPKKQDWKVLPKEDAPLVKWAKEQGPVAWMDIDEKGAAYGLRYWSEPDNRHEVALYTTPPTQCSQRPSRSDIKPLTDEQMNKVLDEVGLLSPYAVARAIEAAHGIKE